MRINHNIAALNTHRQLGSAQNAQKSSMEKLSSGMRINGAKDDAAGLAISEKMRGQIRGLDQASANAQDANSMIQTAEGALNETHSILQRMRELAVQSSNDTNTDDDREKIQSEVDELAKEITRISNTTEFNTQNLMAGGSNSTFHIGANEGQNVSFSINAMDADSLGVADSTKSAKSFLPVTTGISSVTDPSRGLESGDYKIQTTVTASSSAAVSNDIQTGGTAEALVITDGDKYTGTQDANYLVKVTGVSADAADNSVSEIQYSKDDGNTWSTVTAAMGSGTEIDGMTFTIANEAGGGMHVAGDQYSFKATAAKAEIQLTDDSDVKVGTAQSVRFNDTSATIGSRGDGKTLDVNFDFASLTDSTGATNAATFTVDQNDSQKAQIVDGQVNTDAIVAAGINVSNQGAASEAITKITDAITTVSEERSKMGAIQNRLDHTINNLGTSSENLTAAESRIRDVDYDLAAA